MHRVCRLPCYERNLLGLARSAGEGQGAAGSDVVAVGRGSAAITGGVVHLDAALDCVGQGDGEQQVALFPYTTLFRSEGGAVVVADGAGGGAARGGEVAGADPGSLRDRMSTRLNYSHRCIAYAVCRVMKEICLVSPAVPAKVRVPLAAM